MIIRLKTYLDRNTGFNEGAERPMRGFRGIAMANTNKPGALAQRASAFLTLLGLLPSSSFAQSGFRPPAVPLVTHDPYFSVWSVNDTLNGGTTAHWTGAPHPLTSLIRIDGKVFRLMGNRPASAPVLPQRSVSVQPTQTIYTFENATVAVTMTFTSPLLPDDLDIFSRPASYITWSVRSVDGKPHDASLYLDASGWLTVNRPGPAVVGSKPHVSGLVAARLTAAKPQVLPRAGDDLRIEWGSLFVSAPTGTVAVANADRSLAEFTRSGRLPKDEANATNIVAALTIPLGKISDAARSAHATLAYDDEYSIQFFGKNLRPYWRRSGATATDLLTRANHDYADLMRRCAAFDAEVVGDLKHAGGDAYAIIGSLAYRQSFAAQKLVADANGQPLMFSKENFSNGCIATVDVLYPAAPQLLLFSPSLTKASLVPILEYAASPRWRFPFAPHDLGTYPLANGQVYGGGEETEENQMPVEESGNMLILLAALAKREGNADFSAKYWPQISRWAAYLADKGFDPESQLSTDDFAGHLAHNVNLSAKAIAALAAYADLCDRRGLTEEAAKYRALTQDFARRWVKEAADGDHYRLAFDRPNTWSQKYNLVWDRLLGYNLFPAEVYRTELDYYRSKLNPYGLPLDNRRDYTKLDWILWTATLTGNSEDFQSLVEPIVKFLNATPDRVPMGDWFQTIQPRKEGFQARSVVGGVFIKLLDDEAVWSKYARRDTAKVGGWAPIPKPDIVTPILPTATTLAAKWRSSLTAPAKDWFMPAFSDAAWTESEGGFGTEGTPGAAVRTAWNTGEIWIRRSFALPQVSIADLKLFLHHDEDAEVYINGILVGRFEGYTTKYTAYDLPEAVKRSLRPTGNTLAIHCRQTSGGQYIDAGLVTVKPAE